MTPKQDIVITGVGVVSPLGIGKEPFWAALANGRSGIRRLELFDDPTLPAPFGGAVVDFDPKQYVRPRKSLKVMSRDIQVGFAAADLAFADANLRERPVAPERIGVIFGADLAPCELDEVAPAYAACMTDGEFHFDRWGTSAMSAMFPLWMLKYLPNMPACHIGIAQDARGPNNTITLGDVSTLSALAEAVRVLQRGQADAIVAGGVNSRVHPVLWTRSRVVGCSQRADDPAAASRPFDSTRDGVVVGEGAGSLVLETVQGAQARGAQPLARILGYCTAFEPTRSGELPRGTAIRRVIAGALADARLAPADLGLVIAHGVSTIEDDRCEAQAIRDVLSDVPVTGLKSYFGHLGPAAGALEAVAGVLALQHGEAPPTLNYEHPDPLCPINVVHGGAMSLDRATVLLLSHTRHGQAVAVVLGGK